MSEAAVITFTDRAAAKVRELREEEGNPALKLRVYITGGGCSGFSYGFTFDERVNDDDTVVDAAWSDVSSDTRTARASRLCARASVS